MFGYYPDGVTIYWRAYSYRFIVWIVGGYVLDISRARKKRQGVAVCQSGGWGFRVLWLDTIGASSRPDGAGGISTIVV